METSKKVIYRARFCSIEPEQGAWESRKLWKKTLSNFFSFFFKMTLKWLRMWKLNGEFNLLSYGTNRVFLTWQVKKLFIGEERCRQKTRNTTLPHVLWLISQQNLWQFLRKMWAICKALKIIFQMQCSQNFYLHLKITMENINY